MFIRDSLLTEFDVELPFTRRTLARVPEGRNDWKPHQKSMTLGWLSTFLALAPSWGVQVMTTTEFDPANMTGPRPEVAKTNVELLASFDKHYADCRAAIARTTDAQLAEPWTLKMGGKLLFTQPRWLAYREYIMNHIVHHRAQLGVYLRMNDIAVPAIYNDSADEHGGVFR
jgi:uncharacterized damage-inducible protein DinB